MTSRQMPHLIPAGSGGGGGGGLRAAATSACSASALDSRGRLSRTGSTVEETISTRGESGVLVRSIKSACDSGSGRGPQRRGVLHGRGQTPGGVRAICVLHTGSRRAAAQVIRAPLTSSPHLLLLPALIARRLSPPDPCMQCTTRTSVHSSVARGVLAAAKLWCRCQLLRVFSSSHRTHPFAAAGTAPQRGHWRASPAGGAGTQGERSSDGSAGGARGRR